MDGVPYDANTQKWDEITCPIPRARLGPTYFGNVGFEVSVNGDDWHVFPGGFQYYEQPAVEKIYPAQGPNIGKGKIKFYGKNFKSFALAEPTC